MNLTQWIEHKTVGECAKILGTPVTTVSSWFNYKALPRPKTMMQIVKHTDGIVTYKEMIEDFVKNNSKIKKSKVKN